MLGAASAAVQVAASALVLIFVYRYVNATVGIERFGVWSGVMAVTALANLGECGLGGAALRYVARSRSFEQPRRTALTVETAVLTVIAIAGGVSLAVWPMAYLSLPAVFSGLSAGFVAEARSVLPVVLLAVVLAATSNVVLSSLDGLEQVHERTLVAITGSAVFAGAVWVLVPRLGLLGLALAQALQNTATALLGWARLRHHLPILPFLPRRWARPVATQLTRFGLGWQAVGWANLLMDPLAKVLAIRFGGVAFAGHLEFALRVAPQVRSVVSSAQQALMPLLTRLSAHDDRRLREIYALSMRATLALVLLAQPFLYAGSLGIAWLWVTSPTPEIVSLLRVILMLGFVNLLGNPAYFESAGRGDLRPNIAAHLAMSALNALLAWTLGQMLGGLGVATGYAAALAGGALLLATWHGWRHRISVRAWIGTHELGFALVSLGGTVATAMALRSPSPFLTGGLVLAATALLSLVALWRHPLRRTRSL